MLSHSINVNANKHGSHLWLATASMVAAILCLSCVFQCPAGQTWFSPPQNGKSLACMMVQGVSCCLHMMRMYSIGHDSLCKAGIHAHDLVIRLIQQAANLAVPLQHVPGHLPKQCQLNIKIMLRSFVLCICSCPVARVNTVSMATLVGAESVA